MPHLRVASCRSAVAASERFASLAASSRSSSTRPASSAAASRASATSSVSSDSETSACGVRQSVRLPYVSPYERRTRRTFHRIGHR
eukprot:1189942-Prorocentrum_minimum.AAC.1